MALSITHLGLNEINNHVDGQTSFIQIINDADLNSNDVRVWGNTHGNSSYWSGTTLDGLDGAGVNTGSGTLISMGEFRGAEEPTEAFPGTLTSVLVTSNPGGGYGPTLYYNGYTQATIGSSTLGSYSNTSYTGTLGGRYATHTLYAMQGFSYGNYTSGIISMTFRNTTGAYTSTATDWTSITVGSNTLNRSAANAATISTPSTGTYQYYISWGGYTSGNPPYDISTYFGTSTSGTNYSAKVNLT